VTHRIALVGCGNRGRSHLRNLYELRDQEYLNEDPGRSLEPHRKYHEFAGTVPDWAEDVRDLTPAVTALYDPDEEALAETTAYCLDRGDDPAIFEDYDAFLDADVYDAVVVASPNYTHVDVVVPLAERDVPVLSEKPLASTLADHDRLIEAADTSDAVFLTGSTCAFRLCTPG